MLYLLAPSLLMPDPSEKLPPIADAFAIWAGL